MTGKPITGLDRLTHAIEDVNGAYRVTRKPLKREALQQIVTQAVAAASSVPNEVSEEDFRQFCFTISDLRCDASNNGPDGASGLEPPCSIASEFKIDDDARQWLADYLMNRRWRVQEPISRQAIELPRQFVTPRPVLAPIQTQNLSSSVKSQATLSQLFSAPTSVAKHTPARGRPSASNIKRTQCNQRNATSECESALATIMANVMHMASDWVSQDLEIQFQKRIAELHKAAMDFQENSAPLANQTEDILDYVQLVLGTDPTISAITSFYCCIVDRNEKDFRSVSGDVHMSRGGVQFKCCNAFLPLMAGGDPFVLARAFAEDNAISMLGYLLLSASAYSALQHAALTEAAIRKPAGKTSASPAGDDARVSGEHAQLLRDIVEGKVQPFKIRELSAVQGKFCVNGTNEEICVTLAANAKNSVRNLMRQRWWSSTTDLNANVMKRLNKLTTRNMLAHAVSTPSGRPAMEYIYQGTLNPSGMTSHGGGRGRGKNIRCKDTFAAAMTKREVMALYTASCERGASNEETDSDLELSDDSDDQAEPSELGALNVAVCDGDENGSPTMQLEVGKRNRRVLQGLLTTSPVRKATQATRQNHISGVGDSSTKATGSQGECTNATERKCPEDSGTAGNCGLVLLTLQQAYHNHPQWGKACYYALPGVNCTKECAVGLIEGVAASKAFKKYKESWNHAVQQFIVDNPDQYEIADSIIPNLDQDMAVLKLISHGARLLLAIESTPTHKSAADSAGASSSSQPRPGMSGNGQGGLVMMVTTKPPQSTSQPTTACL